MYKRLEKRMKDADYENDMQDVLEILNDNREKYLQSQGLIDLPSDPSQKKPRYTEKTYRINTCRLCKVDFRGADTAIQQHAISEIHLRNLEEYKLRMQQYVKKVHRSIFKTNLMSPSKRLQRLKFFRLVYQFE